MHHPAPIETFAPRDSRSGELLALPFGISPQSAFVDAELGQLLAWLENERSWFMGRLHRHGALLLRGFRALRAAEEFEAVVARVSTRLLDYAGGNTPRSAVHGKVVTSTDAPQHLTIGLHQEMSYLEPTLALPDPTPDLVAFFCVTPPLAAEVRRPCATCAWSTSACPTTSRVLSKTKDCGSRACCRRQKKPATK